MLLQVAAKRLTAMLRGSSQPQSKRPRNSLVVPTKKSISVKTEDDAAIDALLDDLVTNPISKLAKPAAKVR